MGSDIRSGLGSYQPLAGTPQAGSRESVSDGLEVVSGTLSGTDSWQIPAKLKSSSFFEARGEGTMVEAFQRLSNKLEAAGHHGIISGKTPSSWLGREATSGTMLAYDYRGGPEFTTRPGKYYNFSPIRRYAGSIDPTTTGCVLGTVWGQVGQTDALVVQDSNRQTFVVRADGFVASGIGGAYRILERIDTKELRHQSGEKITPQVDPYTKQELGVQKDVLASERLGSETRATAVATFLNIPMNNVAVTQNGNKLAILEAGPHNIIDPNTTVRGFYTRALAQVAYATDGSLTGDGATVGLNLNVSYTLQHPEKLALHNFKYPFDAMKLPIQQAVNAVLTQQSYREFLNNSQLGGDKKVNKDSAFMAALKHDVFESVRDECEAWGIKLHYIKVNNVRPLCATSKDMQENMSAVVKNLMELQQVETTNQINIETEQGQVKVAEQTKLKSNQAADAAAYQVLTAGKAQGDAAAAEAEGKARAVMINTQAEVSRIRALADARAYAIQKQAETDAAIDAEHAKKAQLERIRQEQLASLPNNTTLFANSDLATNVTSGFTTAVGVSQGLSARQQSN